MTGGSIVNQVEDVYNGLDQLTGEYQAVSGAVNTSTTPEVQYTYTEMSSGANNSRLTGIVYPGGYTVDYNYGSGLDSDISRLTSLSDDTGTLETFTYLGLDTVVQEGFPEADMVMTEISQTGLTGDAGDPYTGLDRFGRVVEQLWFTETSGEPSTAATVSDYKYGYDADGNVLWKSDGAETTFSEIYTYDALNQLASFARGTLNSTDTGISGTASQTESWTYDAVGNRTSDTTNGTTVTSTANLQNEVTGVSGSTTPTYDADGNMTTDSTGLQYVYNAWGQVVTVKNSSGTTLETETYDGLGREVTDTVGGTTTDLYYSAAWQLLEESSGGMYTTRYGWSPVAGNSLVQRDTDTSGTGLTATGSSYQRLWAVEDANDSVVALVNASQTVVERYAYDPFGAASVLTGSYGSRSSSSYGWVYLFQGGRQDGVTGTYSYEHRDLNTTLGRWDTMDPTGFTAGDVNFYRFVGNEPTTYIDPTGFQDLSPVAPKPQSTVPTPPTIDPTLGIVSLNPVAAPSYPMPPTMGPILEPTLPSAGPTAVTSGAPYPAPITPGTLTANSAPPPSMVPPLTMPAPVNPRIPSGPVTPPSIVGLVPGSNTTSIPLPGDPSDPIPFGGALSPPPPINLGEGPTGDSSLSSLGQTFGQGPGQVGLSGVYGVKIPVTPGGTVFLGGNLKGGGASFTWDIKHRFKLILGGHGGPSGGGLGGYLEGSW